MDKKEEEDTPASTAVSSEYDLPIDGKLGTKLQEDSDVEANIPSYRVPQWKLILLRDIAAPEVVKTSFNGSGTPENPYIVGWLTPHDPFNPMTFSPAKKWLLTILSGLAVFSISFCTAAWSGTNHELHKDFDVSDEVITLGMSLFLAGFCTGPLVWAPLSELYGRQLMYTVSFSMVTILNVGVAGAGNIQTLLILRFFGGVFGVCVFTNSGGTVADLWGPAERGKANIVLSGLAFMSPTLAPIVAGFLSESAGWRWVQGLCAILTGMSWLSFLLFVPETYGPFLLRKRAHQLSIQTGKVHISKLDVGQEKKTLSKALGIALARPWSLLFHEPIVLLLSVYLSICYGTQYLLLEGFPIVYQDHRGWSEGVGGLAFLGIAVGMLVACIYAIFDDSRYLRVVRRYEGFAPPESRLPPVMVGSIAIPLGMFWFAWTNGESVHWAVSIVGSSFFGFGFVLVYLGVLNYLIDSYTVFAASSLAANVVLRYFFGAVFPLFTRQMYSTLGIHWASSVPAFLSLLCVPMPFLFHRYGSAIRKRCKFGAESAAYTAQLMTEKGVMGKYDGMVGVK